MEDDIFLYFHILQKLNVNVWTLWNWHRIGVSSWFLWTMMNHYWEQILPTAQGRLYTMELAVNCEIEHF